jgi:FkbM family methyltransferase
VRICVGAHFRQAPSRKPTDWAGANVLANLFCAGVQPVASSWPIWIRWRRAFLNHDLGSNHVRQRADWIAHVVKAATQQHHTHLRPVFAPWIPSDAQVIDVGAHAGQFSKLFARMAPQGRVYAFEPSAYARSILTKALAWNRLHNVSVIPAGLSDAPGEAVLHTPIKPHGGLGFGLAHFGDETAPRGTLDQTTLLMTLDAFVEDQGLTRLDFIKADVEGWEAHVLRGGPRTLERFRPALYLEVIEASLERAGATAAEIWDRLTPLGYEARLDPGFEVVAGFSGPGDYLFTPKR